MFDFKKNIFSDIISTGGGDGLVAKSWLTLGNPVDCSPLGSSVHGILQARTLKWVAISFSRGSSRPGMEPWPPASPALPMGTFTAEPPGESIENSYFYYPKCSKCNRARTRLK